MIEPLGSGTDLVDPTRPLAADPATEEAANASASNDTINQEQFLLLFIEQLQNQDPLNPLDVNGMTDQLAQFSSLEQLFGIKESVQGLGEKFDGRQIVDPLGFLGTEITVPGDTVTVSEGQASPLLLEVPDGAVNVRATIQGPEGSPLRTFNLGTPAPGELEVVLDGEGTDDENGGPLADGAYPVVVTATLADGESVQVDTLVRETVTGIDLGAQPPLLLLGDRPVEMADVRKIRSPLAEE